MNYRVVNRDDTVHILNEEAFSVCHLDADMLQALSYTDDANCSACIFMLASSASFPVPVLYKVASYIQKQFPELGIDWFTTFYHVEKNSYLSLAFRMKEWLEETHREEAEHRYSRFSDFEQHEPVENVDAILLKIVMMNIINFDVKMR